MDPHTPEPRNHRFLIGLLTGTAIGAGLALWLTPRAAGELRERLTESAKDLSRRAADRYQDASGRVNDAVDEITRKGQGVRDGVADAVARGAHEVERFATAAKSDRGAGAKAHS